MGKKKPVYDVTYFLGMQKNFGKDVKKINLAAVENPLSSL
jgi:hypothetical protein